MKTSMLGKAQRRALVKRWPEVATRGVADGGGHALFPGDLVRLPADVRLGSGEGFDVPGTVIGFAVGKDGSPSVAVHALARSGGKVDSWRTWIVNGTYCNAIDESAATQMLDRERILPLPSASGDAPVPADQRAVMSTAWMQVMVEGVRTKGGVVIKPGVLVRLPRNVARNRGSQLHAAGTCLGYAIGLDGSPWSLRPGGSGRRYWRVRGRRSSRACSVRPAG